MKISNKALWGILAVSAIGLTVYLASRRKDRKKLKRIAEEGYEVAHDILFPDKKLNEKKLRYGPVLPE